MMLMLQRFDSKGLELAMLLDEPPYRFFNSSACGEPWRPDGPLATAAMSIDLNGYAWLYVAYISDKASTWGAKLVKLVAGGTIFRKELNSAGMWIGKVVELSFETVLPTLFHNIVGEPTRSAYQLIPGARIQEDPDATVDEKGDELLGLREKQVAKSEDEPVLFGPAQELGLLMEWRNEKEESEKWWIQNFDDYRNEKWRLKDFGDCRFALTEYQRRPFVQLLLARLGFVKEVDRETGRKRVDRMGEVCRGHLKSVVESLQGISQCSRRNLYPFEEAEDLHKSEDPGNAGGGIGSGNGKEQKQGSEPHK